MSKQVRISLSDKDAEYLADIAKKMGIKEAEVMKKGLQLMALYARTRTEESSTLILKDEEGGKEVMII